MSDAETYEFDPPIDPATIVIEPPAPVPGRKVKLREMTDLVYRLSADMEQRERVRAKFGLPPDTVRADEAHILDRLGHFLLLVEFNEKAIRPILYPTAGRSQR